MSSKARRMVTQTNRMHQRWNNKHGISHEDERQDREDAIALRIRCYVWITLIVTACSIAAGVIVIALRAAP